jgi:predicted amino acid racemase
VVELQLQEVISNQTKEIQQLTTNVLGLTKEVADLEGTLGTVDLTTLTANQKATCQTLGTVNSQVKTVTGSLNSLATNLLNVELLGLHVLKVGETTPVTETLPKEVSCP